MMRGLLIVIALIGPIVAIIFGTHALWTWLDANWGTSFASMIVAIAFLLIASLSALVALLLKKAEPPKDEEPAPAQSGGLLAIAEAAITRRPFESISVMVGLGALLARHPGLAMMAIRRFL
ncbi:hypothetical protein L5876_04335 [Hyphobacterium sp. SN044]|uniref:hypothetical protein n=1 Tax=Hyphobacterium sp. SN044 TaxID=2912575 RepID=UPI001F2ABC61|nr:hypothetical protein [Hyphobacterium sp. SN044]MCF8879039.1 hypothetical protein [Hyphobacterium sp. SN044]